MPTAASHLRVVIMNASGANLQAREPLWFVGAARGAGEPGRRLRPLTWSLAGLSVVVVVVKISGVQIENSLSEKKSRI